MIDRKTPPHQARVVLFGMRCAFTAPVLDALAAAPDVDLRAVVLPDPHDAVTMASTGPVLDTMNTHHSRLIGLGDRSSLASPEFRATLHALVPDVIVVACFPWRLPAWLLALPKSGCLNIHPSLLPDGRGPEPVFWAFRWNLTKTGVTLHVMDAGLDTGPVLAQRRVVIPENVTMPSLERELAVLGAGLLIDTLPAVLDGTAVATPQAGERSRYARIPRQDDLFVDTTCSARDAARFIRAVAPVYAPLPVLVRATGQRLNVSEIVRVTDDAPGPEPVLFLGPDAFIRFARGTLVCRLAAPRQPLRLHVPGT